MNELKKRLPDTETDSIAEIEFKNQLQDVQSNQSESSDSGVNQLSDLAPNTQSRVIGQNEGSESKESLEQSQQLNNSQDEQNEEEISSDTKQLSKLNITGEIYPGNNKQLQELEELDSSQSNTVSPKTNLEMQNEEQISSSIPIKNVIEQSEGSSESSESKAPDRQSSRRACCQQPDMKPGRFNQCREKRMVRKNMKCCTDPRYKIVQNLVH